MTQHTHPGPQTPAQFLAFQQELDALRLRVMRSLGAEDARYVKTLLWLTRVLEVGGRGLLLVAPWWGGWLGWAVGVGLLTVAHLIETMELGHNLMHGQFNWMNDPRVSAHGYRWNFACDPADWREFHNHVHHHYSNVLGRDRDYGSLRLTAHRPWMPVHLLQALTSTLACLTFEWGVATHNLHLERRKVDPEGARQRIERLWPRTRARLLYTARREYLWWPLVGASVALLAAWTLSLAVLPLMLMGAWSTLSGNLAAGMARNIWAYFIIACGHFTTEAHTFDEADLAGESKGQWYLRQVLSAANIEGGIVLDVLSGNATHQIEHHIYPDMPSNRLAQIAPEVRRICERHGVPYHTGSLPRQVATVVWRITRHSWPGGWHSLTRLPQTHLDA